MESKNEYMTFNLNEQVLVKLKDAGIERMVNDHNTFVIEYNNVCRKKILDETTIEEYKKKANAEGYYTFQMWAFMESFGAVTGIGTNIYYETNILIKKSK
jgi:hypothetical protein